MRIIAGKYRGKKLFPPVSEAVRPTADRARESVFNILRSRYGGSFAGLRLLDVFAGTGAFGFEGISQGFSEACLIDSDLSSAKRNAALFAGEAGAVSLVRADATRLPRASTAYDVVFLDAPYGRGLTGRALESLAAQGWIAPGALIIAELEKGEDLALPEGFELVDERVYGIAKFLFLKCK